MGIKLLQSSELLLDTILNNPNARTSTDGVQAPRIQQTAATTAVDNRSSYNQPQQRNAVVLPPSGVVDAIAGGSQSLGIPSGYQSTVRGAVSGVITTVLQTSQSQTSDTDVGSNQYRGNVATRLFSGIRGFVASTAPTFGVDANAGPLSSGLAVLANSAINIGKNAAVQKYGTAILNAQQYAVFGTAVLDSFRSKFDNLPEVKQTGTIKSVIDLIGGSTAVESTQQATQLLQQGIRLQPPGGSSASIANNSVGSEGLPNPHTYKVYLESSINASELFVFKTQPIISISESAQYSEFSPLHAPGHFLAYKNSPSRTFSITDVKLISRNASEAQDNLQYLNQLRAWTKPYFGRSQANQPSNTDYADEPTAESVQINSQANTRLSHQGASGITGEIAAKAAAAAELANSLRQQPGSINTYDPINGTLLPNFDLPNVAAASSRTVSATLARVTNPILSKTEIPKLTIDGNQNIAEVARLSGYANTASTQVTPITPSAADAVTPNNEVLKSTIGSPPPVLYFYGYSEDGITATNTVQNIRRVPVVVASVGFSYPNDVDYIPTLDGVPFPTVMNITLDLRETKAPYEIEQFSLADFKAGKLIGW
jgi:hypothetical protein